MNGKFGQKQDKRQNQKRSGKARALAELAPEVGGMAFRRFGFIHATLFTHWREIVGDAATPHCTPRSLQFQRGEKRDGTLTIACSGAFSPFLQHSAPLILERVNRLFGYRAVAHVQLRQEDDFDRQNKGFIPKHPASDHVVGEMAQAWRDIRNSDLQASLAHLARYLPDI